MEPVVANIPRGFDVQSYLPNWENMVNVMRLAGAEGSYRFYEDCTHVKIAKASPGMLVDNVDYFMSQKCPVLFTTLK